MRRAFLSFYLFIYSRQVGFFFAAASVAAFVVVAAAAIVASISIATKATSSFFNGR